jgi:hypothetical protein
MGVSAGRDSGVGMIWLSTPKATVGLVVRDAVVVDAPPYARRWALGADARVLWRRLARNPANRLEWLPGDAP